MQFGNVASGIHCPLAPQTYHWWWLYLTSRLYVGPQKTKQNSPKSFFHPLQILAPFSGIARGLQGWAIFKTIMFRKGFYCTDRVSQNMCYIFILIQILHFIKSKSIIKMFFQHLVYNALFGKNAKYIYQIVM